MFRAGFSLSSSKNRRSYEFEKHNSTTNTAMLHMVYCLTTEEWKTKDSELKCNRHCLNLSCSSFLLECLFNFLVSFSYTYLHRTIILCLCVVILTYTNQLVNLGLQGKMRHTGISCLASPHPQFTLLYDCRRNNNTYSNNKNVQRLSSLHPQLKAFRLKSLLGVRLGYVRRYNA